MPKPYTGSHVPRMLVRALRAVVVRADRMPARLRPWAARSAATPVTWGVASCESECMREEDVNRLRRDYTQEQIELGPERRVRDALDLDLTTVADLATVVVDDLSSSDHGIHWWTSHLGDKRRILVADQLAACTLSISTNIVEAKLHLLEYQGAREAWKSRVLKYLGRSRDLRAALRCENPEEDLSPVLAELHAAGVFRAVASALDCFGGVIIGVAALPTPILKADMASALAALRNLAPAHTPGTRAQVALRSDLNRLITAVGPPGWLDWTLDMRNMFTHRGRRISWVFPRVISPGIEVAPGTETSRVALDSPFPKDPARSDVEVMRDCGGPKGALLAEDGGDTIDGVFDSATALVTQGALQLQRLWELRRGQPSLLSQPVEQWKSISPSRSAAFDGYRPLSVPLSAGAGLMASSPTMASRILAAAVDDVQRGLWASFSD